MAETNTTERQNMVTGRECPRCGEITLQEYSPEDYGYLRCTNCKYEPLEGDDVNDS